MENLIKLFLMEANCKKIIWMLDERKVHLFFQIYFFLFYKFTIITTDSSKVRRCSIEQTLFKNSLAGFLWKML